MSGGDLRSSSMELTLNDARENMEHAADPSEECSLPGVCEEPKMCPRVGTQFQALIPDLIEGNECSKPIAGKVNKAINHLLPLLPIPLMWAPNKARDAESLRAHHSHSKPYAEENQVVLNCQNGNLSAERAKEGAETKVNGLDIRLEADRMKLGALCGGSQRLLAKDEKYLYPLPGTPDKRWSDFECDAYLLALYIFGKDLYLVQKFVETKKMEDVISYYYGPFYKCTEYQRWAKVLRSRSRKSIHGQRMFTRGRQQELFSRLSRRISDKMLTELVEASKTFKEEGISFEDYVFTLRDLVGTKLLIEVVAIGKGKQDLTGISTESIKLHRSISVRRETQQDKGLSSLSCKEIAEQLTSSRLSKTKSNELFWEAVWPRLLAGGWHSEQPKDGGVLSMKHQLVFLMPGIKKFRRKKLVKGQHYFDSVSDVLNKVASDPRILELENEKEKSGVDEENDLDERDSGLSHNKNNGYLKLCNSNERRDKMEFMIVDTSKRQGSKVQWMQTLPLLPEDISSSSSTCSETGRDSSCDKSDGKGNETNLAEYSKYGLDKDSRADVSAQMANGIGSLKKRKIVMHDVKKSSKKHQGNAKSGPSKYLSPLKRHEVNAAGLQDLTVAAEKKNDKHIVLCLPNPHHVNESKQSLKGLDAQFWLPNYSHALSVSSQLSLPNPSPKVNKGSEYMVCEMSKEMKKPFEQPLPHAVIDLNIPPVLEDVENNHDMMIRNLSYSSPLAEDTTLAHVHKYTCRSSTSSPREKPQQTQLVCDGATVEQQQPLKAQQQQITQQEQQLPNMQQEQEQEPDVSGRRHSTRNRPLTKKALEAFESSFFETKKKQKHTDSLTSRPSRRQLGNSKSNSTSDSGIGTNDMTGTRIEEESPSGNSGNAPV